MIDIESQRALWREDKRYYGFETASDDKIKQIISEKIESARKEISKSITIFPLIRDVEKELFRFSTCNQDANIFDFDAGKEMTVETKHLQEVGFGVMKKFGLDESQSTQISAEGFLGQENIEITTYPSNIEGLSFQREVEYGLGLNHGVKESVKWSIVGKLPHLKMGKILIK